MLYHVGITSVSRQCSFAFAQLLTPATVPVFLASNVPVAAAARCGGDNAPQRALPGFAQPEGAGGHRLRRAPGVLEWKSAGRLATHVTNFARRGWARRAVIVA